MLAGFGNGVRPVDGIQITNNQPFLFQELSSNAVDTSTSNTQVHHQDKANNKHKFMQMLKVGIMFHMFEVSVL
jgi:hypothetical protein